MEPGGLYLQRLPSGRAAFVRRPRKIKSPGALLAGVLFNHRPTSHRNPDSHRYTHYPDNSGFEQQGPPKTPQIPVPPYDQPQLQTQQPQSQPQSQPFLQNQPDNMMQATPCPPFVISTAEEVSKLGRNGTVYVLVPGNSCPGFPNQWQPMSQPARPNTPEKCICSTRVRRRRRKCHIHYSSSEDSCDDSTSSSSSSDSDVPIRRKSHSHKKEERRGRRRFTKRSSNDRYYTSDVENDRNSAYTVKPVGHGVYDPSQGVVNTSNSYPQGHLPRYQPPSSGANVYATGNTNNTGYTIPQPPPEAQQDAPYVQAPPTLYTYADGQYKPVAPGQYVPPTNHVHCSCNQGHQCNQYVHSHCPNKNAAIPTHPDSHHPAPERAPRTYYNGNQRVNEPSPSIRVEPQGHGRVYQGNDASQKYAPPSQPSYYTPHHTQYARENRRYSEERERPPRRETDYPSYFYVRHSRRDDSDYSPERYSSRRERSPSRRRSHSRHRRSEDFNSRYDDVDPRVVDTKGRRYSARYDELDAPPRPKHTRFVD
ncbi:hypothetical protein AJ79_03851 [Helicocarpus griseus UAMH5409]|uniref:Uncharacterized protein n=1 Tax=Helicocarpus griseus UAMH5409 TaxID=1447875 RepID=A0A2B7XMZ6_9EURO|nr:hypothetical protein AJ79_03851 [Helicocarpus griseus UAMH5409]